MVISSALCLDMAESKMSTIRVLPDHVSICVTGRSLLRHVQNIWLLSAPGERAPTIRHVAASMSALCLPRFSCKREYIMLSTNGILLRSQLGGDLMYMSSLVEKNVRRFVRIVRTIRKLNRAANCRLWQVCQSFLIKPDWCLRYNK